MYNMYICILISLCIHLYINIYIIYVWGKVVSLQWVQLATLQCYTLQCSRGCEKQAQWECRDLGAISVFRALTAKVLCSGQDSYRDLVEISASACVTLVPLRLKLCPGLSCAALLFSACAGREHICQTQVIISHTRCYRQGHQKMAAKHDARTHACL